MTMGYFFTGQGKVKCIAMNCSGVSVRELSFFTGRGDRLFVIAGRNFFWSPPWHAQNWSPPLTTPKNSGPPHKQTAPLW